MVLQKETFTASVIATVVAGLMAGLVGYYRTRDVDQTINALRGKADEFEKELREGQKQWEDNARVLEREIRAEQQGGVDRLLTLLYSLQEDVARVKVELEHDRRQLDLAVKDGKEALDSATTGEIEKVRVAAAKALETALAASTTGKCEWRAVGFARTHYRTRTEAEGAGLLPERIPSPDEEWDWCEEGELIAQLDFDDGDDGNDGNDGDPFVKRACCVRLLASTR